MTNKIDYSYDQFESDCRLLAEKIHPTPDDAVVALKANRPGGLFFAKELESLDKFERVFELNYALIGRTAQMIGPLHGYLRNRRVFVLTEIANSGRILQQAIKDLQANGNSVVVVAIHYRKGSQVKPNIYLHQVMHDVHYPWEPG